jgi:uncharacterized membrane protein YfcA
MDWTVYWFQSIDRYHRQGLIDGPTVKHLTAIVVPAGVAGGIISHVLPEQPLRCSTQG